MRRSENIKMKQQRSNKSQPYLKPNNFCVPGILSKCGAGATWTEHRHCKFAKKSTSSDKCMHYIEAIDGHCDCLDAQKDSEKIIEDK
jgi:hypothetical protein